MAYVKGKDYKRRFFTPEEDEFLRKNFAHLGPKACAVALDRPRPAISTRAMRLGIHTSRTINRRAAGAALPKPVPQPATQVTPAAPVPPSWRRLAAFDPITARACREADLGLAPGELIDGNLAGYQ